MTVKKNRLPGKQLLITAGPTREPLDAVRFLSNPSTGKMGFCLAAAAAKRGARVTLVSGPTQLPPPAGVAFKRVNTTREMLRAVRAAWEATDIFIAAAAPADYRPEATIPGKLKKADNANLSLLLLRNPDILKEMSRKKGQRVLVGFAGEVDKLTSRALGKLREKQLDLIVANDLTQPGAGFAAETNEVTIIYPGGKREILPRMRKEQVAEHILTRIEAILKQ